MRAVRRLALLVGVLAFALVSIGADSCSTETKNTADSGSGGGGGGGGAPQPAAIGDSITLQGSSNSVQVTPTKVIDPLPVGQFDSPLQRGNRFVGVMFTLKNVGSKTYNDSPSNGAVLVTRNNMQADATLVSGGPCSGGFDASAIISAGSIRQGCIPFEVPKGQKVKTIQFTLDSGFGPETGEWNVP